MVRAWLTATMRKSCAPNEEALPIGVPAGVCDDDFALESGPLGAPAAR